MIRSIRQLHFLKSLEKRDRQRRFFTASGAHLNNGYEVNLFPNSLNAPKSA